MAVAIRPFRPEDAPDVFDLRVRTFSSSSGVAFDEEELYIPDDRRHVATDDGRLVGHVGRWRFTQTFGGRAVPMDGVAAVIVEATHRGRGVASRLLDAALEAMTAARVPISTLYPATVVPYRRKGWEVAGVRTRRTIPTRSLFALPAPVQRGVVRRARPGDLATLVSLHDTVTATEPGGLGDTSRWLRRNLTPDPDDGDEVFVVERDGTLVGFVHQERGAPGDSGGAFTNHVHRLVGLDRDAELDLWRFVGSSWSVGPVTRFVSRPADPLLHDLAEEDLADVDTHHWMTRLVDVAGAVAARGWSPGVDLTLPLLVADDVVGANAGAWVLEVADGGAALTRGGPGRVPIDVRTLAAMYTGFLPPAVATRRGLLRGATEAEVEALGWALAGPTPFLRDYF